MEDYLIRYLKWLDLQLFAEGGDGGGERIATGTPEEIVKVARSYTGKYLKGKL